ncbi:hypothetical protein BPOR_0373g00050 [Botrytis porri]|uniref:Uncharacterized protein n=1 Tax=Botrytis porri TaxID=87229 RepID=A0A4Z1KK28_9HELO|nr:hypothetical protein BPOR_0373g00050 [Botrytis porri]
MAQAGTFSWISERPYISQPITPNQKPHLNYRPRKSHTKSRNGCNNCRKRRIKTNYLWNNRYRPGGFVAHQPETKSFRTWKSQKFRARTLKTPYTSQAMLLNYWTTLLKSQLLGLALNRSSKLSSSMG